MIHLVLDDELCFILRWTNSAPLPCGSCAPSFVSLGSCTSLGSVLILVLRVRLRCVPHLSVLCSGSWSCLGHPQPPWRTRHGCTVGVNRDPPVCSRCPGSMASVAERQPYVRWPCTPPRPGRSYDLVDFGITLLIDLIHFFIHELLTHARRHVACLCTAMSRPIQPELPWYCSMPQRN